ncbi:PLEKHG7 (predicted) [Pycnogonum litorale]
MSRVFTRRPASLSGLVGGQSSRNSTSSTSSFLNLPSPNLPNEEHDGSDVLRKLSNHSVTPEDSEYEEAEECPPASALTRRRALVPPKLLSEDYEVNEKETDTINDSVPSISASGSPDSTSSRSTRRSSIVVIPPMQICPGDLLVYSKVLSQRNNLIDIDGSTQSLSANEENARKAKAPFSLLKIFDRSASRIKTEPVCGLEEVLSAITPSEFDDEQLGKYKGSSWNDFVLGFEDDSASTSPDDDADDFTKQNISFQMTSKNEQKRREAIWDLFQSECMFLFDHLMVLKNVYMEPLKKIQVEGFAMFAEPEILFGNLDELCCVTYAFCKEFVNLILDNIQSGEVLATNVLVRLFQRSNKTMSLTQAYHRYALNYINALNYLETLRRHIEFIEFEKWSTRDPRCKKLQLTDLLVAPVQHIMKTPLILKDIETRTEDLSEKEAIGEILEMEESSIRELDDKMKWLKNFERLLEIQRNIAWPSVLDSDPKTFIPEFLKTILCKQPCERLIVSPRRQIIMEGSLQLMEGAKPADMYMILFDDMLLITRRKKGLSKKKSSISENWPTSCSKSPGTHENSVRYIVYKQPLSLDRFIIYDVASSDGAANNLKHAFVLVSLNRFQQIVCVYTFQAPNESTKITWLTKIRDAVDRWKRILQNMVFKNQENNEGKDDVNKE